MKNAEVEYRINSIEAEIYELRSLANRHEIELQHRPYDGDIQTMKEDNENAHANLYAMIDWVMNRCQQLEQLIKETWGITNVDDLL